jgi:hypothetical protein
MRPNKYNHGVYGIKNRCDGNAMELYVRNNLFNFDFLTSYHKKFPVFLAFFIEYMTNAINSAKHILKYLL